LQKALMMKTTAPDIFWERFTADDLIEIKAVHDQQATRYWIHLSEWDKLIPELKQFDCKGFSILGSVNSRSRQGSSELDVSKLASFHADVDSVEIPGDDLFVPLPSLVVNSGHGYHLYWYAANPITVDVSNRERLKAINRGLARAVGGDSSCCGLSRILRIPGL
jgi:hypothetical protein